MNWIVYGALSITVVVMLMVGLDNSVSMDACQQYHSFDTCAYAMR